MREHLAIVSVDSVTKYLEVFYTWDENGRLHGARPVVGSDKFIALDLDLRIRVRFNIIKLYGRDQCPFRHQIPVPSIVV